MDIFDKCRTDGGYFGRYRAGGDHYYTRPILEPRASTRMEFEGRKRIMWSVNNYLGLAGNFKVKRAAIEAARNYSISSPMGARMMSGNTEEHLLLERQLAQFSRKEAAILFNYGYLGVIGTIDALVEKDDVVVIDKLAHACIVDGARLCQAQLRVFRHNDMNSLEQILKHINRERKGGVLIVTEGTYGMTGDLARLPEICDLKERYGARLMIDDAHGVGVMGPTGRGTAEHFGVQDRLDIYFGTFAKAFAAIGGFASGPQEVIDWISYNARTQVFAKSLPMVYVKALQKTLEFVIDGEKRRKRMWNNAKALKRGLHQLGYHIGSGESPICSVFVPVGDKDLHEVGAAMVRFLREHDVFVSAVVYPVIPLGLCMFRMIPTTAHTRQDVDDTVEAFRLMKDELQLDLDMTGEDRQKVGKVYAA